MSEASKLVIPVVRRVLVHADGGACHGTPLVNGRCPCCGIAPDMQSMEFWTLAQIAARGGAR